MTLDSAKLRTAIEAIEDLPTLPTVVTKITSQIRNPATNATDIGKLIEQDQVLTGKVLRLVNSAYYGFPKQIRSIQNAVVILGFNKIRTVVITASVFDLIKRDQRGLDVKRFWQHSLGAAIASRVVAETLGDGHAGDEAFVGGLLHDIGKIVLDQYQPAVYGPIVKYAHDRGILLVESEKAVMGLTHAKVGEWIAEKWRLPSVIVNMVRYHHSPTHAAERRDMATAVHLGDILARALGVGYGGDNRIPVIDATLAGNRAIDSDLLDSLVNKVTSELDKADEFFALISGDI